MTLIFPLRWRLSSGTLESRGKSPYHSHYYQIHSNRSDSAYHDSIYSLSRSIWKCLSDGNTWNHMTVCKLIIVFFQAAVVSIYECITWILIKCMEKNLDSNYTRMLRAVMNKSWKQHPTKQQLCGHLPPISKTIQIKQTRHAGHCRRSKDELISDVFLWTPFTRTSKCWTTS